MFEFVIRRRRPEKNIREDMAFSIDCKEREWYEPFRPKNIIAVYMRLNKEARVIFPKDI